MGEEVHSIENRQLLVVIRTAGAALCFILYLAGSSAAAQQTEMPSTAAGRCATSYMYAFNSGNHEIMQTFEEEFRASSYLKARSLEERLSSYDRLRGIFGQLRPVRVALSLELQLTLLADAEETDDVLVMRFQLEKKPPHRLAYLTFTGIDHSQVDDEYADYVATRAAPIDTTLRASTIESVAVVLRERYVYPDLGRRMANALLKGKHEGQYERTKAGKLAVMLTENALKAAIEDAMRRIGSQK